MNHDDRPTPPDALPRAQPPRPRPRSVDAEGRAVHGEGTLREPLARQREAIPPPAPPPAPRQQERKRTPVSGGVEVQPRNIPVDVVVDTPRSRAPTRGDWSKLGYKLVAAIVGALVSAVVAGGVWAVATVNDYREDRKAARVAAVAEVSTADALAKRVARLEEIRRADAERTKCVEAQLRDALSRGTGHVLSSLPSAVEGAWAEQNKPKAEPRTLWARPTWFTLVVCPAPAAPP